MIRLLDKLEVTISFNDSSTDQNGRKNSSENQRVIQIGLSTHSHDHEINPVTFSTAKIKTKAIIGSILDRLDFFSVRITEPP